jgi:N-acylneuraminate cytidylyltransferase
MKSIAIIPARGGSKRIPRKNIKDFLGKPIIAYSIKAALESKIFDEVMVSTDDEEIAEISKKYGASVPFFRSREMSNDMAMTAPVLIEVLNEYEKLGKDFTHACCLYPCAPFITAERLKEAMNLLVKSNADSVFPIVKFSYPPQRCFVIRNKEIKMLHPENYNIRSQDLEPLYHDAGQFYCMKVNSLKEEIKLYCNHTLPIILTDSEVQDIDTEDDWKEAEIKYKILKGTKFI